MRISLGITFRLAMQALAADPAVYRAPDEVMRRTYGLIVISEKWDLYVMVAEKKTAKGSGERQGEEGIEVETDVRTVTEAERLRADLQVDSYVS